MKSVGAGRAVATGIGLVAIARGSQLPVLGAATSALLLGLLAGPRLRADPRLAPGISFTAKKVLALTIVLLGATLQPAAITSLGISSLVFVAVVVFGTLTVGTLIGRALGLPFGIASLVAAGNAICGTSAIAATAPLLADEDGDAGVAIGVIHTLGLVGLLLMPVLSTVLALEPVDAGLLVGGSLQAVGHVVAASFSLGEATGDVALPVKMARVMVLVPTVIALAVFRRRKGSTLPPPEVVGFTVTASVALSGALPADVISATDALADGLLTVAMVGIGASIDLSRLRRAAPRALAAGALTMALQVAVLLAWVGLR
jgi:uncharacterized integral membrane protein (TIGR00698 family)